jgi:WD40 repeat protein
MTAKAVTLKELMHVEVEPILFCAALLPDSQRLFVGGSDFKVYEIDLAAEKSQCVPLEGVGHQSYITGLARAGRFLVSGSYDQRLIWWDADERRQVRAVMGHERWIRKVAASPDGQLVASIADDMQCKLWDVETCALIYTLSDHAKLTAQNNPSMLHAVAFSADGALLATADKVGHVAIWSVDSGKKVGTVEAPLMYTWDSRQRHHSIGGVRSLAFSPDGKLLCAGGIGTIENVETLRGPSRVEVFDWQSGRRRHELSNEQVNGIVERIVFHPSGDWYIAAGGDNGGFVTIRETLTGAILHQETAIAHIHDLCLNAVGDRLYAAAHKRVIAWELHQGTES